MFGRKSVLKTRRRKENHRKIIGFQDKTVEKAGFEGRQYCILLDFRRGQIIKNCKKTEHTFEQGIDKNVCSLYN